MGKSYMYISKRKQLVYDCICMIPSIWNSEESKNIEMMKRSVVAKVLWVGRVEWMKYREYFRTLKYLFAIIMVDT